MTITATPKKNTLTVCALEKLPNGVGVAMVKVTGAKDYLALPGAIEINGIDFGKTGWNSDRMIAYFRTDAVFATF